MKNHWLKLARQRNNKVYTAEVEHNLSQLLSPTPIAYATELSNGQEIVTVEFLDKVTQNKELQNFLTDIYYKGLIDKILNIREYSTPNINMLFSLLSTRTYTNMVLEKGKTSRTINNYAHFSFTFGVMTESFPS